MEYSNFMKTLRRKYGLVVLLIIGLQFQHVYAQYAEDVLRYSQLGLGTSARQLGMGNATVGGVNDYSALFWNPAGLALERNFEFSFGLSSHGYSNEVSYLGSKTSSNNNVVNLNNLGLVYPIPTVRGSLTFAFGFNRAANYATTASMSVFNANSSFSQDLTLLSRQPLADNIPYQLYLANADTLGNVFPILKGNVQQAINVIEGGGLNHWTFGGAMDIAKNLSVGVSLNYATGSYSFNQNVSESDSKNLYPASNAPNDFSQFTYESTINDEITGFNALLGLMFRKPEKYSIGFAIRTATTYNIAETYGELASSQFKTMDSNNKNAYSYPVNSNSIKYEVITPYTLSGGISIQPFEWLLLAGDAEYTDWSQMELQTEGLDFSAENSRIKNQMRATTNLRGGGELSLWKLDLKLRGGIIYNPSPWKNDPSSFDQLYYTAGIGYMLDESTTLDAGFAYGTWKTLRTNYSYSSASGLIQNVGTDETVTTSNLNLTLIVRF
jgi:long-subunit fatty acid transport protein